MLVEKIIESYKRDSGYSFSYRASSSGKCARALAYSKLGIHSDPLPPRSLMVFELGNMIEKQCVMALGSHLHSMQKTVEIVTKDYKITGSIDGIYEDYVVDFKSTNTRSFSAFAKRGEVDESYLCQMHCYMKGLGLKKALLVWYNKDTSHLHETSIEWSDDVWSRVVARFDSVYRSTMESLPEREHKPNDKGKLPWQCSYCAYTDKCYPEYEKVYDKKGKPSLEKKRV